MRIGIRPLRKRLRTWSRSLWLLSPWIALNIIFSYWIIIALISKSGVTKKCTLSLHTLIFVCSTFCYTFYTFTRDYTFTLFSQILHTGRLRDHATYRPIKLLVLRKCTGNSNLHLHFWISAWSRNKIHLYLKFFTLLHTVCKIKKNRVHFFVTPGRA